MTDVDEPERLRRVEIYAELVERDPRRSVFAWPESPPARPWPPLAAGCDADELTATSSRPTCSRAQTG